MTLRYTTDRLETVSDNDNFQNVVVPALTKIFEMMDKDEDGSLDEDEGSWVRREHPPTRPEHEQACGFRSGLRWVNLRIEPAGLS